ncbi:MAG: hypothetical protein NTZ65_03715 [Candidatus Berkelbacteria bacterium]|nr:hypothetical protein [Candidatus Berkelbacteria bacterium]
MDNQTAKIKVFVDLDDTLLDTAAMKRDIFQKVVDMGVSEDVVRAKYEDARKEHGGDYLKPFAESFAIYGVDSEHLYLDLQQIATESGEYLLENRLLWLDQFQDSKHELILLTYGNPDVQERKVQGSHLENIFEGKVVYVKGDKVAEIRNMIEPGEKFIFVDDKREIIDSIIKEYPEQVEVWQAGEKEKDPEAYYSPLDLEREGRNY